MPYLSLYRKYRSQVFDELVGQEHITKTLSNAIERDRIAHAYLFSGPRGTGKTSTARIFAKCINCEEGPTINPCNVCSVCESIIADRLFDVIEIDAASNRGIDDVRDLKEKVRVPPSQARRKVYIIDEVHMLTREAFNALLKTLEEPPSHVLFLMATTEPQKLPPTILSRCQRFDFRRLTDAEIGGHITKIANEEGFEIEPGAVELVVRSADGSLRDAISILDQLVSFTAGKVSLAEVNLMFGLVEKTEIFDFMEAVFDGDTGRAFELFQRFFDAGKSFSLFLRLIMEYARDLFLVRQGLTPPHDTYTPDEKARLKSRASSLTRKTVVAMMDEVARVEDRIRWEVYPRIILEVLIIKLIDICTEQPGEDAAPAPRPAAKRPAAPAPAPAAPAPKKTAAAQSAPGEDEPLPPPPPDAGERFSPPPPRAEKTPSAPPPPRAPEPAPEPAAPVAIPEGASPFEKITLLWPAILADIKKESMPKYFFFADGSPLSVEENKLTIRYARDHQFKMDQARTRDNAALLAQIVEKHFGGPLLIDYKLDREESGAEANGFDIPAPAPEAKPEPAKSAPPAFTPPPPPPQQQPDPAPAPVTEPEPEPAPQPAPKPAAGGQALSLFDEVSSTFPESMEIKE